MSRGEAGERVPRLLLVADGFATGRAGRTAEEVQDRAVALVRAGVPWVSLRDHSADVAPFRSAAVALVDRLREIDPGIVLSAHGRLGVAVDLGLGVHVGWRGASLRTAREAGATPLGVSAHTPEAVGRALRDGADYATLSPVFATGTHPDAAPLGLDVLAEAARHGPVLALGGLTPARAADARRTGAHGAAVLSGLFDAADPAEAARRFLAAVADP